MGDEKRSPYRIEEMRVLAGVQPGGMTGLNEKICNEEAESDELENVPPVDFAADFKKLMADRK